jgi:NAD(P)-dependent dehydrogenase (short-subunit alcohol dehydrogenase family)
MAKIALITGANKGIGFETARQLAQAGVKVIIGARDGAKGEAAAEKIRAEGYDATAIALDVASAANIAAAAERIAEQYGHLDILINNAGVMLDDRTIATSAQTLDTWRATFDTNVFGLIAVTQAFLPLLKKAPAGRIVNLSSILGSLSLHSDPKSPIYGYAVPAYNVSKSAVNAWTVQLAVELKDSAIKVNAAHPGHVQTDMGGASAPMALVDGAKTSVQLALLDESGPSGGYFHLGQPLPW